MKIVFGEHKGRTLKMTPNRLILLSVTALVLAGCESIPDLPDVVNPMSWFSDDKKTDVVEQTDSTNPYPKLKSAPERPKLPSLAEQQAGIAQGLSADTKNAKYTDAQIRKEVQKRAVAPASRLPVKVARPVPVQPPVAPRISRPAPLPPSMTAPVQARMQAKTAPVVPTPPNVQNRVPAPKAHIIPPTLRRPALAAIPPAPGPNAPSAPVPPPMAPMAPMTRQATPAPQITNGLIQIGTIYFADGSTVVQRVDTSILRQIADAQRQSGGMLEIVGHASGRAKTFDQVRRSAINYKVSLSRAKSVGAALVGLGVPVSRLRMDGAGDSKQVYSEFTATGEAANRRVEIFLRR